jgi:hypothetical protein
VSEAADRDAAGAEVAGTEAATTDVAATAVAEAVRRRLLAAALAAWEDAGLAGLCAEGRWECAVSALREADLGDLVAGLPDR